MTRPPYPTTDVRHAITHAELWSFPDVVRTEPDADFYLGQQRYLVNCIEDETIDMPGGGRALVRRTVYVLTPEERELLHGDDLEKVREHAVVAPMPQQPKPLPPPPWTRVHRAIETGEEITDADLRARFARRDTAEQANARTVLRERFGDVAIEIVHRVARSLGRDDALRHVFRAFDIVLAELEDPEKALKPPPPVGGFSVLEWLQDLDDAEAREVLGGLTFEEWRDEKRRDAEAMRNKGGGA